MAVEKVQRQVNGLDYLPLQTEQLALVVAKRPGTAKAIRYLPACLKGEALRQSLGNLVGYRVDSIGECLYET